MIYAENGRGKTTLAAIFRSLAIGDPLPITERQRLGAAHPPHVVLGLHGIAQPIMFQNNAWNHQPGNVVIFDDAFVDENLYSGLTVEPGHRQHLHELIIGSRGVQLNQALQQLVQRIETHNGDLRTLAAAIPAAARGPFDVDAFCALNAPPDVDAQILAIEQRLAAAQQPNPIASQPEFEDFSLPAFDVDALNRVLGADLGTLDQAAAERVREHVQKIGTGAEAWLSDGMNRIPSTPEVGTCPFCGQDLAGSPILAHFRAFFSREYADLKRSVSDAQDDVNAVHGGTVQSGFERAVRVAVERHQFWSRFCDVPAFRLDTAAIVLDWTTARDHVLKALTEKQSKPLDPMQLSPDALTALAAYEARRTAVASVAYELRQANVRVRTTKAQVATTNTAILSADLTRLKAMKARQEPTVDAACNDYLAEKAAKTVTEGQRTQARTALDQYRTNVFPQIETAINRYLTRFNAGFRLANVTSANTKTGSQCHFNLVINNVHVPVAGGAVPAGTPCFRNTLSGGDRNTLALSFFLATLDNDPTLADKVVVIDDPVSSLDEHRSLTTVQEIVALAGRCSQVILLSHSRGFLCRVWNGADRTARAAAQFTRLGNGSTLQPWDVRADCLTEHDRRDVLMREYLATATPNAREVASAIRPHIEAFLRVAYPAHFPPERLLGPFHAACVQNLGGNIILDRNDTDELGYLIQYANRFHHDTNPAWETEIINDGELRGFLERALAFVKR